jgi:hypothetical protein
VAGVVEIVAGVVEVEEEEVLESLSVVEEEDQQ